MKDPLGRPLPESVTPREEKILDMKFNDKMTFREIGDDFGITASRVGHILQECLRKIVIEHRNDEHWIVFRYGKFYKYREGVAVQCLG